MKPDQLLKSRQNDWQTLDTLLKKAEQKMQKLTPAQTDQLGKLYRATTSDLALAQRDFPNHQVTAYLNQLVARTHATIYRGEAIAGRRIWHFVTTGFPQLFRETLPFTVVAALMFILPAIFSAILTHANPEAAKWILPAETQQLVDQIERQELWTNIPIEERPYASSFIMTNNIRVSFLAFAGGILLGLFTLYVMIFNGLLLGGVTGLTAHYGIGWGLWEFVIGHGVIELSVIFIAGGSGFMLGWAMLRPGLMHRRDALAQAANKAVRLIFACVPLLVIAGTIEGFISPAETIPAFVKWGVGLGTGVLLYGYLFLAGRNPTTK